MPKRRNDIKDKIIMKLRMGPANIKILSKYAACARQTTKVHVTELERDGVITSGNFGNQRVYWLCKKITKGV